MALETTRAERFSKLVSVLQRADHQFADNLSGAARSVVLYRIAGSFDKMSELTFFLNTVKKIKEKSGNVAELGEATNELSWILSDGTGGRTLGQLFSSTTSILDVLSPKEIYQLLDTLRKQPVVSDPPESVPENPS